MTDLWTDTWASTWGEAVAIEGVDYSFDHPTVAQLKTAGKRFACRYLTGTTSASPGSKNLTPTEAQALQAGGIDVVSNYETSIGFMLEGYDSGARRADAAWKQHKWCGGPDHRPIYFSLDMNATLDEYKQAYQFMRGAASAIGWDQVGMYGGLAQVDWAAQDGIKWLWQAAAWSYGVWSRHSRIQQYKNGQTLGSGTVDYNRAIVADFGQWTATKEDLSIVDAETRTYLDGKFAAVQQGLLTVIRGDATTDPVADTHPNNIERTRQDLAAGLSDISTRLDTLAGKVVQTVDPAAVAALVAGQLEIVGVSTDTGGVITVTFGPRA